MGSMHRIGVCEPKQCLLPSALQSCMFQRQERKQFLPFRHSLNFPKSLGFHGILAVFFIDLWAYNFGANLHFFALDLIEALSAFRALFLSEKGGGQKMHRIWESRAGNRSRISIWEQRPQEQFVPCPDCLTCPWDGFQPNTSKEPNDPSDIKLSCGVGEQCLGNDSARYRTANQEEEDIPGSLCVVLCVVLCRGSAPSLSAREAVVLSVAQSLC